MSIDAVKLAQENEVLTIEQRRHIHRHPELSGQEFETLKYIRSRLDTYGVSYVEVEDGGILGFLGDENKGRTLILRADIDALPIVENPRNLKRERTVISENPGIQHACGHDAHAAMLLTAAKILRENESKLRGRVILFFERGEEGTGNIRQLLKYIEEKEIHIDAAHGIHVDALTPAGKFIALGGPNHAGACAFHVTLIGEGGHGSRPDLSANPIDAFAGVYNALNSIRLKYISPFEQLTFSVGQISSGTRANVIPGKLEFSGTLRFYNQVVAKRFVEEFRNILEHETAACHCTYETEGFSLGLPLINNDKITELIQGAVGRIFSANRLIMDANPSMGSESFSLLAKLYPSAMIYLGVRNEEFGSGAAHHSEYFDLDEAALHDGVAETIAFAFDFLNYGGEIPFKQEVANLKELLALRAPLTMGK
ncbi:MAG: amidohydrolase [Peptococcaceae bacterium]|jgi:amidohydrolase|nr:amidohydrolase [Peptococcaceae bacterium]